MDDKPIIINTKKNKKIYVGNADYHFDDKKYTLGGIISVALSVLTIILAGTGIFLSYRAQGNAAIHVGVMAVIAILCAVCGIIIAYMSFGEKDCSYVYSKIGFGLNLILLILMGCVFLIGI